jgi:hypothetical protein
VFKVTTDGEIKRDVKATITATYGGVGKQGTLLVQVPPVSLVSVTLAPATVVAGKSAQGTVTLSGPAPAGGAAVALASDNTKAAVVPARVRVEAGKTSAVFKVTTDGEIKRDVKATITATYGGVGKQGTLTVQRRKRS